MALPLARVTKSDAQDPTSTLRSALEESRATLSPEQELQYDAAAIRPHPSTVIAFVREMDETISFGTRGRRVSNTMLTFLDALQQFTGIVDTFVSSNPTITAIVWGSVRTAILFASNIGDFFIKLTELIMRVGQMCPVYANFAGLYLTSTRVQHALCSYYTSVVRLYTKAMTRLNRSVLSGALSAIINPFEAVLNDCIVQLERDAKVVKLECETAAAKAAEQEYKSAAEEEAPTGLSECLWAGSRMRQKTGGCSNSHNKLTS